MEIILILLIIAGAMTLFISERFSASLVAMMTLCTLMLITILGPLLPGFRADHWVNTADCSSGFSNQAALSVAGMFILSAGLQRTGAIRRLGTLLTDHIRSPYLLITLILVLSALASAFINNTAAVAVFLPLLLAASRQNGVSPSRVLIPLSYASQVGGVCTLIGTSTNLLVAAIAVNAGLRPFGLFEFAPLGLVLCGTAALYFLIAGRFVLPQREGGTAPAAGYQVSRYLAELRVLEESRLVGAPLPLRLETGKETSLLHGFLRNGLLHPAGGDTPVHAGDILLVEAPSARLLPLASDWGLRTEAGQRLADGGSRTGELAVREVLVAPRSFLIGRTPAETRFAARHECLVAGLHRADGSVVAGRLADQRLRAGDALLVLGTDEALRQLRDNPDLLLLDRVEEPGLRGHRMPLALALFAGSLLLASSGLVPILFALLLGAVLMIATGCLRIDEAFEAVDWKVIIMLACMIPLGRALECTGAASLIASQAVELSRPWGPYGALVMVYLVTAVLTEFMSNNATAVLLSPIAISVAGVLGLDPRPLLVAVCFAASTSFCTPVGYQTNAMVQNPGGYRFADYLRAGLPLNLLFLIVSVICIPLFWPF